MGEIYILLKLYLRPPEYMAIHCAATDCIDKEETRKRGNCECIATWGCL